MAKVLLDTSVVIDFLRRKDKEKSALFLLAEDENQLFASIITHTELYAGKSVWENQEALKEIELLFSGINLLLLDELTSKEAGRIRANYQTNLLDAIIAATALRHSLSLATLNVKDFEMIKKLQILHRSML